MECVLPSSVGNSLVKAKWRNFKFETVTCQKVCQACHSLAYQEGMVCGERTRLAQWIPPVFTAIINDVSARVMAKVNCIGSTRALFTRACRQNIVTRQ